MGLRLLNLFFQECCDCLAFYSIFGIPDSQRIFYPGASFRQQVLFFRRCLHNSYQSNAETWPTCTTSVYHKSEQWITEGTETMPWTPFVLMTCCISYIWIIPIINNDCYAILLGRKHPKMKGRNSLTNLLCLALARFFIIWINTSYQCYPMATSS